jgi:hypothetical protein
MVSIGFKTKPFISTKLRLKPANWEFSTKNPVIKILRRKDIPVNIILDISQYVRKLIWIVKNLRNGSVINTAILNTKSVAKIYRGFSGITIPVNIDVEK